jgi:hypothetical protein
MTAVKLTNKRNEEKQSILDADFSITGNILVIRGNLSPLGLQINDIVIFSSTNYSSEYKFISQEKNTYGEAVYNFKEC